MNIPSTQTHTDDSKLRDFTYGVKDLAQRSVDTMSESALAAQRRLGHYASATGRYVTEQPLRSALIAAVVGAAVAGLIIALRHNRHPHH
ncbi:MAG: hypothetical protein HY854_03815 [Burkholderiales bacterium]|nr:hypothetical protein [Burkholderiales bacterium]